MRKPIILITGGPAVDSRHKLDSKMINKTYSNAIFNAGGIPIMDLDDRSQEDYIELCDGVIFSGTHEFTPGGSFDLFNRQEERKTVEGELMLKFVQSGKPIFAICQGMQMLNYYLGGDLHEWFKFDLKVEHYHTYHKVFAEKGSLLNNLFGDEFIVNSFHNFKVRTLADCLKPTAFSPDKIVEAYEHKSLPVYGFQFHPERMSGDYQDTPTAPDMSKVFEFFINLCKQKME